MMPSSSTTATPTAAAGGGGSAVALGGFGAGGVTTTPQPLGSGLLVSTGANAANCWAGGNASGGGFEVARLRTRVHPAVILSLLDAHGRLPQGREFALAVLLGTPSSEGTAKSAVGPIYFDVRDCIVLPYTLSHETGSSPHSTLSVLSELIESTFKLKQRINPRFQIIGWGITSSSPSDLVRVSEWSHVDSRESGFVPSKLLPEPFLLTIDASLNSIAPSSSSSSSSAESHSLPAPSSSSLLPPTTLLQSIKTYTRGMFQMFSQHPTLIDIDPHDTMCLIGIVRASRTKLPLNDIADEPVATAGASASAASSTTPSPTVAASVGDFKSSRRLPPQATPARLQDNSMSLALSLNGLESLLAPVQEYVDQVVAGKIVGDSEVGRRLSSVLCCRPSMQTPDACLSASESAVQQAMMIAYLASMMRLQVAAAEGLTGSFNAP